MAKLILWLWAVVATGLAMWLWHRLRARDEADGVPVLLPAPLRRVLIAFICAGLGYLFFSTVDLESSR